MLKLSLQLQRWLMEKPLSQAFQRITPTFLATLPEADVSDGVECLFKLLLQNVNVKFLNGKGNPTPHKLYSSDFRMKVSFSVSPLHPPSFYDAPPPTPMPQAFFFIGAATQLYRSLESRYVTLVQRPVRLAVSYSIVKCPS